MVQPYYEGHKLEALMTELNAYYNEESNCREMNIQDVCEGECFAAGIVLSGCCHLSVLIVLIDLDWFKEVSLSLPRWSSFGSSFVLFAV